MIWTRDRRFKGQAQAEGIPDQAYFPSLFWRKLVLRFELRFLFLPMDIQDGIQHPTQLMRGTRELKIKTKRLWACPRLRLNASQASMPPRLSIARWGLPRILDSSENCHEIAGRVL